MIPYLNIVLFKFKESYPTLFFQKLKVWQYEIIFLYTHICIVLSRFNFSPDLIHFFHNYITYKFCLLNLMIL